MSLVTRGIHVLRNEGLAKFGSRFVSFVSERAKEKRNDVKLRLDLIKGKTKLSVNNTKAEFVSSDKVVARRNRKRLREEKSELKAVLDEVKPEDVFYDIGANTGLYSIFVANKCQNCQVVAFEPYPPNISELKKNARLNKVDISVIGAALSDKMGEMNLTIPNQPTPSHGTGSLVGEDGESTQTIRTVRGDEVISKGEIPPPNIIKIDVEGAEPLVIDGLSHALSHDRCRLVQCELHPDHLPKYGSSVSDIISRLEKMGFHIELHLRWGDDLVLHAEK